MAAQTPACRAAAVEEATTSTEKYSWQGSDEYSDLEDRKDAPPLALPSLKAPRRVVLVRHGQSTWNAEGRIQGSCNESELTDKGKSQAETTEDLLRPERFDKLFQSPLRRSSHTASIIWGDRSGDVTTLPSLREIDLYNFQGLLKHEGKAKFGNQFATWQKRAAELELEGHAPVRELWYRASLAWQKVLGPEVPSSALLVAHNAVNQALICTALDLPPTFFRKLLQSNAATTVLDFQPLPDDPSVTQVIVDRLNQMPGPPYSSDRVAARLVMVRCGETPNSGQGLLLGTRDEELTILGDVQAQKAAELLMDLRVTKLMSSPLQRAMYTAKAVQTFQALAGHKPPQALQSPELTNRDWGEWDGQPASEVMGQPLHESAESVETFFTRVDKVWKEVLEAVHSSDDRPADGHNIVLVSHASVISALLCNCLGLDHSRLSQFRFSAGSITVIEWPSADDLSRVNVRCTNYTAHLGRWSVPVTREEGEMEGVCGIDGCF